MTDYVYKLIKGAGIIFSMSILESAFGYFIRILLAKRLTMEEFGLFFAVYSIVLVVGSIKSLGTGAALQKFIPEYQINNENGKIKSLLSYVFSFNLLTSLVLLITFYFFPEGLINTYFKSDLAKPLLLLLFIFVSIDSFSKLISAYFLSRHFSFLYSIEPLIAKASILILLLVMAEINVLGASWIHIVTASLALAVNFSLFFRHFSFFRYKALITKRLIKEIFTFTYPLTIRSVFGVLMARVDTLALVYFRPLLEVAIYNAILPTADILLMFGRSFGKIIFPMSSELWILNNKEKIVFLVKKVHFYLFLLSAPLVLMMSVFSRSILKILFGIGYAEGALGLQILAASFLFGGMNIFSSGVLMGIGKPKEATKAIIVVNILNLGLNFLLIPFFGKYALGYLGAIIATAFCQILLFFTFWYYLKRFVDYSPPFKKFFLLSTIGFSLFIVGLTITERITNIYTQMIVFALIVAIFYPLLLLMYDLISKKEIMQFRNMLNRKKNI